MHSLSPADELAEIRAEIARLQAREADLRATLLATPEEGRQGRWHRVEVTEQRVRQFDPALLPEAIRTDPAYWRESLRTVVRTLAVQARGPRPGWPIRRSSQGAAERPMH
ncbi:hypothetical protein [Tabrizicola sp. M-4]|uniref:hypothetical protein n=1 Tax=Tabrizicola sp. M-4 TaxID=3055847 RepID=UPI003DA8A677